MKIFHSLLWCLWPLFLTGQGPETTDSLKRLLNEASGKDRVELLVKAGEQALDKNADIALAYGREALPSAIRYKLPFEEARAKSIIGISLMNKGNALEAIPFLEAAKTAIEKMDRKDKLSISLVNLGNAYSRSGNHDQAYECYQQAASSAGMQHDSLNYGRAMSSMGSIHAFKKEYATALAFHTQAANIFKRYSYLADYASALNNQGVANLELKRYTIALGCFNHSMQIRKSLNVPENLMVSLYNNMALIYNNLQNPEQATFFYRKALQASRKSGDTYSQAAIHLNLGSLLLDLGKKAEASACFDSSLSIAGKIHAGNIMSNALALMADLSKQNGDFRQAALYLEQEKEVLSNYMNDKTRQRIEELQIKFETEKRKKELAQINLDLKRRTVQNTILVFTTLIILLLLISILFHIRSISHKRKQLLMLYEKLRVSESALRESNETKDKLFSIVTHDLKNPLGMLCSMAGFLNEHYETIDEAQRQKAIRALKMSVDDTGQLLDNLTQWALTQGGKLTPEPEFIDLQQLGQSIILLMKHEADLKNIRLENNIPQSARITSDRQILKAILRNLVGNAVKFTGKGGNVTIGYTQKENNTVLYVRDNGIGIPDEAKDKLFRLDLHHTTVGTSNEKGSGLGLILAREFAHKIGAEISFESRQGEGTVFHVSLTNLHHEAKHTDHPGG
ncbi:MAG TPA: tetratricopeptide repeat-containing sensor histidine kinase [Bacteroidales bacterium]|nr:tetratricopeptide repeat-containing sensor histidine kinase [Bacteroidales bacterium]HSA44821.1 tetratricopeptide repeat-containing sensor histidine kinase [Bacteroidales bacterium]